MRWHRGRRRPSAAACAATEPTATARWGRAARSRSWPVGARRPGTGGGADGRSGPGQVEVGVEQVAVAEHHVGGGQWRARRRRRAQPRARRRGRRAVPDSSAGIGLGGWSARVPPRPSVVSASCGRRRVDEVDDGGDPGVARAGRGLSTSRRHAAVADRDRSPAPRPAARRRAGRAGPRSTTPSGRGPTPGALISAHHTKIDRQCMRVSRPPSRGGPQEGGSLPWSDGRNRGARRACSAAATSVRPLVSCWPTGATTSRPAPACGSRSPGSPSAACSKRPVRPRRRPCSPATPPRWSTTPTSTSSSRSSAASSRPASSSPTALARRQAGRHRQQGAARQLRRRAVRHADAAGVDLLFEAAVAGGIPIIRPLRESLAGEHIRRVMGIVNGTTNYILTRMTEEGTGYGEALAEAQALGYAERDPTADVEGYDAGAKAAILASIAFGAEVVAGDVYHEGISSISASRHRVRRPPRLRDQAARHRRAVRRSTAIAVRVHPAMVPDAHPLAGGPRLVQRRVRRGRRRRRPHVLRPRRRRRAHRPAPCSATSSTPPVNLRKGTHATIAHLRPAPRSGPSTSSARVLPEPRRASTSPACSPPSPASSSAARRVDPLDGAGGRSAPTPASSSSPTRPARPTCRPRCDDLREHLDVIARVNTVLRVLGVTTTRRRSVKYVVHPRRGARARTSPTSLLDRPRPRRRAVRADVAASRRCRTSTAPSLRRGRRGGDVAVRRGRPSSAPAFERSSTRPTPPSTTPTCARWSASTTRLWLLELFHGPTIAFKDVALQLVGRLFDHVLTRAGPAGHDPRGHLGRHRLGRHGGLPWAGTPSTRRAVPRRRPGLATCSAGR